eukprot:scaffold11385_cov136-Isochrysis_galbana.AAC.1
MGHPLPLILMAISLMLFSPTPTCSTQKGTPTFACDPMGATATFALPNAFSPQPPKPKQPLLAP